MKETDIVGRGPSLLVSISTFYNWSILLFDSVKDNSASFRIWKMETKYMHAQIHIALFRDPDIKRSTPAAFTPLSFAKIASFIYLILMPLNWICYFFLVWYYYIPFVGTKFLKRLKRKAKRNRLEFQILTIQKRSALRFSISERRLSCPSHQVSKHQMEQRIL